TEPASVPAWLSKIEDTNLRRVIAREFAERLTTLKSASDKAVAARAAEDEKTATDEFVKAVPEPVRKDWDDFAQKFAKDYRLTEDEKAKLGELTTEAMAAYGRWATGAEGR